MGNKIVSLGEDVVPVLLLMPEVQDTKENEILLEKLHLDFKNSGFSYLNRTQRGNIKDVLKEIQHFVPDVKAKSQSAGFATIRIQVSDDLDSDLQVVYPPNLENSSFQVVVQTMLTIQTGFLIGERFAPIDDMVQKGIMDLDGDVKSISLIIRKDLLDEHSPKNNQGETRLQEGFRFLAHGITGAVRES